MTATRRTLAVLLLWLGVAVLVTGIVSEWANDLFIGLMVGGGVLMAGGVLLIATTPADQPTAVV